MSRALRTATVNQARPARLVETPDNHIRVPGWSPAISGSVFGGRGSAVNEPPARRIAQELRGTLPGHDSVCRPDDQVRAITPMSRSRVRNLRRPSSSLPVNVGHAILAALRPGSTNSGPPAPSVIVLGDTSTPPTWLTELVSTVPNCSVVTQGGEPLAPVAVLEGCPVEVDGHASARSGQGRTAEALEQGFRSLRPGGLLVWRCSDAAKVLRSTRHRRTVVDAMGVALFRAGFVDTRFVSGPGSVLAAVARRGLDRPPTERAQVLSVVLPVYNERATFETVMDALLAKSIREMTIEVIVVESNSTDGTRDVAVAFQDHPRVTVVLEDRPQGKGHAVRTGLARARGDIVVIQDADLEYDLDDYEKLLDPIRRFETSFVLGRRTSPSGSWGMRHFETQHLISRIMNIGHLAFAALFNLVYGQHLKDPFTMYKVFRRDCITGMVLECNRFDFDWELTAKLIRAGYLPLEIPVRYQSRSYSEGKKVRLLGDPASWFVACARYRFAPVFQRFSVTYGAEGPYPSSVSVPDVIATTSHEPLDVNQSREPTTS